MEWGLKKLAATYSRGTFRTTTIGKAVFDGRVRDGIGSGHRFGATNKIVGVRDFFRPPLQELRSGALTGRARAGFASRHKDQSEHGSVLSHLHTGGRFQGRPRQGLVVSSRVYVKIAWFLAFTLGAPVKALREGVFKEGKRSSLSTD